MNQQLFSFLPNLDPEEYMIIEKSTANFDEEKLKKFVMLYASKRKDPQTILILTLLGVVVVAGLQHFVTNKIGKGVLYLLTGGLCLIGTIIDAINYKKIALEYNMTQMQESLAMIG